jgi:formylglycine-generating enzyme required for sulfatase activity
VNDGLGDNDIVDVDVYAIEMVYVPDGTFTVGDNGNNNGTPSSGAAFQFYKYVTGGPNTGYDISSENLLTIQSNGANGNNILTAQNIYGSNLSLPAAFPKGYNGFYCMKYECSQQQYVDFLNSLDATQQSNRAPTFTSPGNHRQMISASSGVYSTTLPSVPVNYITWMDLAAYSDWAGLRPMTELEYEKAARGTATAVTAEYAWGNTSATTHTNSFTNAGASNEVSATSGANIAYHTTGSSAGPIRVGAFANSGTSRSSAGASYYGIMELSGNLAEQVVYVAGSAAYSGLHGNGALTSAGHGDVSNWPGLTSGAITGATGSVTRGGSLASDYIHRCKISDRNLVSTAISTEDAYTGIRGVHTKPSGSAETK